VHQLRHLVEISHVEQNGHTVVTILLESCPRQGDQFAGDWAGLVRHRRQLGATPRTDMASLTGKDHQPGVMDAGVRAILSKVTLFVFDPVPLAELLSQVNTRRIGTETSRDRSIAGGARRDYI
jgi:hypothetical protein